MDHLGFIVGVTPPGAAGQGGGGGGGFKNDGRGAGDFRHFTNSPGELQSLIQFYTKMKDFGPIVGGTPPRGPGRGGGSFKKDERGNEYPAFSDSPG